MVVGDDLPGVPLIPHKRVAVDVDPYDSKIICKSIDATAFWTDSNRHTVVSYFT